MATSVEELHWDEVPLGEVEFPKERLTLSAGFGSGLATRQGDPQWPRLGDLRPRTQYQAQRRARAIRLEPPPEFANREGAKLMPRPDIGPSLALLQVHDEAIHVRENRPSEDAPW